LIPQIPFPSSSRVNYIHVDTTDSVSFNDGKVSISFVSPSGSPGVFNSPVRSGGRSVHGNEGYGMV